MKRNRYIALLLAVALMISLAACGAESAEISSESEEQQTVDAEVDRNTDPDHDTEDAQQEDSSVAAVYPDGSFSQSVTLMVYMIGSNLESDYGCASADLEEMRTSGADLSRVNLLVYTGGSTQWHSEDISSDGHTVLHLTDSGFEKVTVFSEQSMGHSDSLTQFLNYGYENYPADSYGLILWNHGNGPVMGYGKDLLHDGDSLLLEELRDALEASPCGNGDKLAFIGFDACLMASAELICVTAPFADYLIASQETEPGFGWDYSFLEYCGQLPAKDLANNIVSSYLSYCSTYFRSRPMNECDVTLSVFDLSYGAKLQKALDELFRAAAEDVSRNFKALSVSRVDSRALGRTSTGSEYDLVDLDSLMREMANLYPEQTAAVSQVLKSAIVTNGTNAANCSGVSFFYPYYNKQYFEKSWNNVYLSLDVIPGYSEYLSRYSQVWLGTDMLDCFDDLSEPEKVSNSVFTLQLTQEQADCYASGGFYVLRRVSNDQYSVVFYSKQVTEENGKLTADFDGRVIYYTSGRGEKRIPIAVLSDSYDTTSEYICNPIFCKGDIFSEDYVSQIADMLLCMDTATGKVNVKGLYAASDGSDSIVSGKREEIDPLQWDSIQFFDLTSRYFTRDESGRVVNYWDWPKGDWITRNDVSAKASLEFSFEPIYDDGYDYFVMFDIMDVQGNRCCSELLPIQLAQAPEKEIPQWKLDWTEGSSILLQKTEAFSLSLQYLHSRLTGSDHFYLALQNHSDEKLDLSVSDLILDGSYYCLKNQNILFDVESGETQYAELKGISSYCAYTGTKNPSTIAVTAKVVSETKLLLDDTEFSVTIGTAVVPETLCLPIFGARAEEQVLLKNEHISVTLETMGFFPDLGISSDRNPFAKMYFFLKVENISEETIKYSTSGIMVNGIFLSDVGKTISVLPKKTSYIYCKIAADDLIERGISSVSECSFCIKISSPKDGGEIHTEICPVELSEKGGLVPPVSKSE